MAEKPNPIIGPPYNTVSLSRENEALVVTVLWDWDGVSTRETGFDGPVVSIRAQNNDTVPWSVLLPEASKPGGRTLTIQPGIDQTWYAGQPLRNLGLESLSDCLGVTAVRG